MASNGYRRSSGGSAGSNRRTGTARGANQAYRPTASGGKPGSYQNPYTAYPGGASPQFSSARVGDLERALRENKMKKKSRRALAALLAGVVLLLALLVGGVAVYHSPLFSIDDVQVTGIRHLGEDELLSLADVPAGTTLLRVDTDAICSNMLRDSWVKSVKVKRAFPHTLKIIVEEREIGALVEVPNSTGYGQTDWLISTDGLWLMPVPDRESEAGQQTDESVYEDAETVLRISDVPYTTSPSINAQCTDANVNNALNIVSSMTTELADMVEVVKATDGESTTLILKNGPDITFGDSSDVREKERVCLAIMDEYSYEDTDEEGNTVKRYTVTYINVSVPDKPTYRAM